MRYAFIITVIFCLSVPAGLRANTQGVLRQLEEADAEQGLLQEEAEEVQLEREILSDHLHDLLRSSPDLQTYVKNAADFAIQVNRYFDVVDSPLGRWYQIKGDLLALKEQIGRFQQSDSPPQMQRALDQANDRLAQVTQELRSYKERDALSAEELQQVRLLVVQYRRAANLRALLAGRLASKQKFREALSSLRAKIEAHERLLAQYFESLAAHRRAIALVLADVREDLVFVAQTGESLARLQTFIGEVAAAFASGRALDEQARRLAESEAQVGAFLPGFIPPTLEHELDEQALRRFLEEEL